MDTDKRAQENLIGKLTASPIVVLLTPHFACGFDCRSPEVFADASSFPLKRCAP
jgi:hypothetical protein